MILSCTILTTRANRLARKIHPRMPVVLREEEWQDWLDPNTRTSELFRMLEPIAGDDFTVEPVSTEVNRATAEGPRLIERVTLREPPTQGELF
jgi:putative SOS response-associated peptidase YedK